MTDTLPPLPFSAYASLSQFLPLTTEKVPRDVEAAYAWLRALRNVGMAAADINYLQYPRGNIPITGGTVTDATATTISDSANTTTDPKRCGKSQPYDGCYIAIFVKDDPRFVCKANISSADTSSGLTVTIAQDWIARAQISSIGDVVGCTYRVYAAGDISHYDRWPDAPNSLEYISSPTFAAQGLPGSTGTFAGGVLTDATPHWATDEWAGKDLVVWDTGGDSMVHRATIGSNTAKTITASLGFTPADGFYYSVVDHGGLWSPQELSARRTLWYSGTTDGTYGTTHMPDDSTGSYPVAALDVFYDPGDDDNGAGCKGDIPQIVFDIDTWNDCCAPHCCSEGNKSFNPDLWKSDRQIQLSIIGACGLPWIEKTWDGGEAPPLPLTFPVAASQAAGDGSDISSFSAGINSISSDGSKAYIGVSVPYPLPLLYFSLIDDKGNLVEDSTATVYSDETGTYIRGEWSSDQVGYTMRCTWGFANAHHYGFRYMSSKTVWIPSITVDGEGNAVVVDPPSESGSTPVVPYINQDAIVQSGQAPIGVTGITQTDGVATVTTAQPHKLVGGDRATISGASQSGYNGTFPISVVDATTFQIPVDPITVTPATGSITEQKFSADYDLTATITVSHVGSCLVAFGATGNVTDPGAGAITDSQGQTWNYLGFTFPDIDGGGSGTDAGSVGCWYCAGAQPGTTSVNFYPTGSGKVLTLYVAEIVGAGPNSPIDASSSDGSAGTGNPSSSGLTTSADHGLLLSFATYSDVSTAWTPADGYTMQRSSSDISTCAYAVEYQKDVDTGTYGNGFSISNNQPTTCWSLAIKQGTSTAALGVWRKRPASTNYLRYDQGYGSPSEGGPAFTAGDVAEVIGDNAFDPTMPGLKSDNILVPYIDRLYVGVNGPNPPNPIYSGITPPDSRGLRRSKNVDAQAVGLRMSGGIVDSFANVGGHTMQISGAPTPDNNWLQFWYSTNIKTTLTGTCTGGSATTLVDSTAAFAPNGCPTRLWGCTVTVQHIGSGGTVTITKFVINGAGLTPHSLNLVADVGGAVVHAGDSYSIDVPGCLMRVDHGTVTAGSATSMTDSAFTGSPLFNTGVFDSGFTLRTFHDNGDGTQTLSKHFVTGADQATATLTLDAGPTIHAGDKYELDWPQYELNRFAGLWVDIVDGDNAYSAKISGNDQNTLFFESSTFALSDADDITFHIDNFLPGSVLKRSSDNTRWLTTYGVTENRTDPASGNKSPFRRDLRENQPFRFDWYGVVDVGTFVAPKVYNQMFAIMQQFTRQRKGAGWISQADPAVPENNSIVGGCDYGEYAWTRGTPSPSDCAIIFYDSNCSYGSNKEGARAGYQIDLNYYLAGGSPVGLTCQPSGYGPASGFRDLFETSNGVAPSKHSHGSYVESSACGPTFDPENDYCGCMTIGGLTNGTDGNGATYAYALMTGVNYAHVDTATFYNFATFDVTDYEADVDPDLLAEGFYSCNVHGANYFDSSGDPVRYNEWTSWDTEGISGGTAESIKLGSLDVIDTPILPSAPAEPSTNFDVSGSIACGYNVTGLLVTVNYTLPAVG